MPTSDLISHLIFQESLGIRRGEQRLFALRGQLAPERQEKEVQAGEASPCFPETAFRPGNQDQEEGSEVSFSSPTPLYKCLSISGRVGGRWNFLEAVFLWTKRAKQSAR